MVRFRFGRLGRDDMSASWMPESDDEVTELRVEGAEGRRTTVVSKAAIAPPTVVL